ncbi:MAG: hypothetical protein QOF25_652 [Mycobacterium sp.]|nr:hypothetical protein [Mycobacterium sp.]
MSTGAELGSADSLSQDGLRAWLGFGQRKTAALEGTGVSLKEHFVMVALMASLMTCWSCPRSSRSTNPSSPRPWTRSPPRAQDLSMGHALDAEG